MYHVKVFEPCCWCGVGNDALTSIMHLLPVAGTWALQYTTVAMPSTYLQSFPFHAPSSSRKAINPIFQTQSTHHVAQARKLRQPTH
jgi:hypothetical protein